MQVNGAYEEESSDDEKREPLSEVSRHISYHFVFFIFRKTKMARLLMLWSTTDLDIDQSHRIQDLILYNRKVKQI